MFTVQIRDLSEGNGAMWHDFIDFETMLEGRQFILERYRSDDEEDLLTYRCVEKYSDKYYSQPTDSLEY